MFYNLLSFSLNMNIFFFHIHLFIYLCNFELILFFSSFSLRCAFTSESFSFYYSFLLSIYLLWCSCFLFLFVVSFPFQNVIAVALQWCCYYSSERFLIAHSNELHKHTPVKIAFLCPHWKLCVIAFIPCGSGYL